MACRNQGLDDDDDILQQLWEVSSGNSGSDTDSESDMDTFSLNSPLMLVKVKVMMELVGFF